jgi:hypothetical protein
MTNNKDDGKEVFPRVGSSGGGKFDAYSVEARLLCGEPKQMFGHILHKEWKRVQFSKVPSGFGVKNRVYNRQAEDLELLTYQAANALAWWLHAEGDSYSLETRIVKHEIVHNYKETIVGAYNVISGRNSLLPDPGPQEKEMK